MSKIYTVAKQCFICNHISEHGAVGSTSAFGAMDLDTRPPALARHTMGQWIQICPHCGYVSDDLSREASIYPEMVFSEAYKTTDGYELPTLATAFYRHAMIAHAEKNAEREFFAYLHAAWACDDAQDAENAVMCRLAALRVLDDHPAGSIIPDDGSHAIVRADLLRRTGQFDAVKQYKGRRTEDAFLYHILQYQVKLAQQQDDRCHTVDEA